MHWDYTGPSVKAYLRTVECLYHNSRSSSSSEIFATKISIFFTKERERERERMREREREKENRKRRQNKYQHLGFVSSNTVGCLTVNTKFKDPV